MVDLPSSVLVSAVTQNVIRIRFLGMFAVLVGGVLGGYVASNRFGVHENLAKKMMMFVLVVLNVPLVLLTIWKMEMSRQIIWLPIVGAALMVIISVLSLFIFTFHKLERKSWVTLSLAGGLSNLGFTGGAFVCYALFGEVGLGLALIYLVLWVPVVYLVFLPLVKMFELRLNRGRAEFSVGQMFDLRMIVMPAMLTGVVLNLMHVKQPELVGRLHLIDILVYAMSLLSFFAIGLRVSFERLRNYVPLYFSLGAVKFLLTPAMALILLWLLSLTGRDLGVDARNVVIIQSACPCAVVMVTISNVFDLDGRLGSAVWVINNASFAAIVVPTLFYILT